MLESLSSQCDVIRKWVLLEVIRIRGDQEARVMHEISVLRRIMRDCFLSALHQVSYDRLAVYNSKECPHQHFTMLTP